MKIMVCGKGGSGKSSLTVLAARVLSKAHKVYVIDSDESNALLPKILDAEPPKAIVEYLGGRGAIFEKGEVNLAKAMAKAGKGIRLDELPSEYSSSSPEGIRLLTIGKVREFGEGCACPFNFLTRTLLKHLKLETNEMVLVDTDAGIEHLGRGVEEGSDAILMVADPTAESLELSRILKEDVVKLGKTFWLVLNKVTPEIADVITSKAKEMDLEILGTVRFDNAIFKSCLEGSTLEAEKAYEDAEAILRKANLM
jgi:CO dehydrogenase maturation factor